MFWSCVTNSKDRCFSPFPHWVPRFKKSIKLGWRFQMILNNLADVKQLSKAGCGDAGNSFPFGPGLRIPELPHPSAHKQILYLDKQNCLCLQHFKHVELFGSVRGSTMFWNGAKPSSFFVVMGQTCQAGKTSVLPFSNPPSLGPREVVRLILCWGRHLWSYLCHYLSFRNPPWEHL